MAQQIYKSYYANLREAWYQLSKAEQDNLLQKVAAAIAQVGASQSLLATAAGLRMPIFSLASRSIRV